MTANTRAEFPFNVSQNASHKKYHFQKYGLLLFPVGSPTDYWTHGYPVETFHENVNVTSCYAEGTTYCNLYHVIHLTEDCCSVSTKLFMF